MGVYTIECKWCGKRALKPYPDVEFCSLKCYNAFIAYKYGTEEEQDEWNRKMGNRMNHTLKVARDNTLYGRFGND